MSLKKWKPSTPGQRHLIRVETKELEKVFKPLKARTKGLRSKGGRNHHGKITVRHRGGGHRRLYRQIDFKRRHPEGLITQLEYDPNRSGWIARVQEVESKKQFYILASKGIRVGTLLETGPQADIQEGNALPLENIPVGTMVHNIELQPGKGAQLARGAGCSSQLIQKTSKYARIRLPSGSQRFVPISSYASIGRVSNTDHKNQTVGKAGRSRWLGKRPHVRGVAMNPVDHPHGGGEGKTSGGRPSVTPWGRPTKGQPTRSRKKKNKLILTPRK